MNKKIMGLFVFGAILLLSAGLVFAYQGNPDVKGPNYSEDRHEAMQEAFLNVDYDAWYNLMTEDGRSPGVLRKVNRDNFATFVEAKNLAEAGDLDGYNQLRAELGLGLKDGTGAKQGLNKGQGMHDGTGCQKKATGTCPYAN